MACVQIMLNAFGPGCALLRNNDSSKTLRMFATDATERLDLRKFSKICAKFSLLLLFSHANSFVLNSVK